MGGGTAEPGRMLDELLGRAVRKGASDLHIEPKPEGAEVLFRLDGVLQKVDEIPHRLLRPLIVRLKAITGLQVHRTDVPQEGRLLLSLDGAKVTARVALIPTIHGEKAVIRFPVRRALELDELGMERGMFERLTRLLGEPQGTILLTGPANSGKTTTMYASLLYVHRRSGGTRSIYTIEDPVELDIGVASQVEVRPKVGLTFASALRTILRQDPEVIMVGEIRDPETAELAVRAGLTGHLVLSTVHARSAPGVFARLIDMGVRPYLVGSSVTAVIEQRLVRRVCRGCARPCEPTEEELSALGLTRGELPEGEFVKGMGCEACSGTGYSGRVGIFRMLEVTDRLRELIVSGAPTAEIEGAAREEGMGTLLQDGLLKVARGETTLAELSRVLGRWSGR